MLWLIEYLNKNKNWIFHCGFGPLFCHANFLCTKYLLNMILFFTALQIGFSCMIPSNSTV